MKQCPKCGIEHVKRGIFCSLSCSNSRTITDIERKARSERSKNYWNGLTEEDKENWRERNAWNIAKARIKARERIDNLTFDEVGWDIKRSRVINEQYGKCKRCGLDKWLEQPLVLEIDHIDGNNKNNTRDNLEALCPNCHSLTKTWRGRNKNTLSKKVTDEQLIYALHETCNIRKALLKVGLVPKGNNYKRAKKLMDR